MSKMGFIEALISQEHLPLPIAYMMNYNAENVCRNICAYLNDKGGWIVVGMDDDGLVSDITDGAMAELQQAIVSAITPLPLVYVQEEEYKGKKILLVTVMKGSLPPYSYRGSYFVMDENLCVRPTNDQMACLFRDSYTVRSGWEGDHCLIGDEDMLDAKKMDEVYALGKKSGRIRKECQDMEEVLSELQLLSVSNVTNGVLTLFAKETSRILPQCRVRIQVMLQGKTADTYEDAPIYITGNVFQIQQQVLDYFKNRLPLVLSFSKSVTKRDETNLYPLNVIDEAISNALIHRDYTNRVDEVTIFIYADRVEISNTGEMPRGMLSSMTQVLPHHSVLRNPLMAEVFYIAGEMEKTGRGMQLISDIMRANGTKLPEWRTQNGRTTLTIYTTLTRGVIPERALDFLKKHQPGYEFSKAEYAEQYGIALPTAFLDIKAMLQSNRADSVGKGPKTRYIIR